MKPAKAAILMLGLALFSCGKPSPIVGKVVDKQFSPAHDGTEWGIQYYNPQISESCSYNTLTKSEECDPVTNMVPVYGDVDVHYDDAWYLVIQDAKGKDHTVQVTQGLYNNATDGESYNNGTLSH